MIEAGESESGQKYVAAIKGACAGGGFELALACNHIMLVDDGASTVALPEVPLLAVLPGTGGLTRLTDKRRVRRDLCDVFCAMEEGVRGAKALDWRLVDEIVSNSKFNDVVDERAAKFASELAKPSHVGIALTPLQKTIAEEGSVHYSTLTVEVDRIGGTATLMINGPDTAPPANIDDFVKAGSDSYMLRLARELDDAILHLRLNEREAGLLIFRSQGNPATLLEHEEQLHKNSGHWLANEVLLYWKRILKRVDVTSRSMAALVEHGSCFAGLLAELLFSVDRTYMMEGEFEGDNRHIASITLSSSNLGTYRMANGLSRIETRFWGTPNFVEAAKKKIGEPLEAALADDLGLVTVILDDIDWEDEIRIFIEERASFSPDAMTGMEANLRFVGPETMETRIFGRLTAWQNWIFQRPSAVGEEGALKKYGTGNKGMYTKERT